MGDHNFKSRYQRMTSDRTQFLQRARHNALLTIPSLMPLEGQSATSHLIEPYQGLGARGVVHLASRVTLGLLPSGVPYMRLDLPPEVKLEAGSAGVPTETQKQLAMSEQLIQSEVEAAGWRTSTTSSVQQLLVAGNVVEYVQPDNSIRVYRLDQFVVRRDHLGNVLELIIEERFPADAAPLGSNPPRTGTDDDEKVELYTRIALVRETTRTFYRRNQQWGDGTDAGGAATWDVDVVPYLALRWSETPGEDYGRSKVEEHIADLRSLDALEKAQLEMAGMGSRNFIMIAPGAGASGIKNRLVRAINGDVVVGDPDSVSLKSFDNTAGFQITAAQVLTLRESISRAFLLLSGSQRNAERVTATEIERDIAELEAALGGNFSTLAQEMMEVRTRILMDQMMQQGRFPDLPKGSVIPVILTGLEALSRERDVGRAMQAAELSNVFGDAAQDVVIIDKILGRAFIGLGFPDAVRGEADAAAHRQKRVEAASSAEMAVKVAPGVAKELVKQGGAADGGN